VLLIVDYLKTRSDPTGDIGDLIDSFLGESHAFVSSFLHLADDELRFANVAMVLRRMARFYVAYSRVRVPLDQDFIIKMEQIIPSASEWSWSEPIRALRYRGFQWYPIRIGDSRSTHIEVSCEHPIELEQVPGWTRVRVGHRIVTANSLFGRSSHETRYHQHFYTTKTGEDIQRVLGGADPRAPRAMQDVKLGIKYAVERTTSWGYRLVNLVVFAALAFLIAVYDPDKMRAGQISVLPIVPVLFALFGALASLRPQESVVALRMRKYKTTVLLMGFGMVTYFLSGLIWPTLATSLRRFVRDVGLGSFLL
jgi:hypothetical protein